MFCVIQELTTKRENPLGFPKHLEVMQESVQAEDGTKQIKWGYAYSDECFERPVKNHIKYLYIRAIVTRMESQGRKNLYYSQ